MTAETYITVVNTVDVHRSGLCCIIAHTSLRPTSRACRSSSPKANWAKIVEVEKSHTKIQKIPAKERTQARERVQLEQVHILSPPVQTGYVVKTFDDLRVTYLDLDNGSMIEVGNLASNAIEVLRQIKMTAQKQKSMRVVARQWQGIFHSRRSQCSHSPTSLPRGPWFQRP